MDVGVVWTIVGSVAGVVAVIAAMVIGILQLRQGRRHAGLPEGAISSSEAAAGDILPPPLGYLPPQVRGRDELLRTLTGVAAAPDRRVHILAGLGGCGKSTVALAVARQCREAGRDVWWISAVDRASVTSGLLGLAQLLGAPDGEVREALAGRINPSDVLWRRLELRNGWVLILDNADDLSALVIGGRTADGASGWLRPTKAGMILVTSRVGAARAWGPLGIVHPVTPLDVDDGARVLSDLAPDAGGIQDARILAARLGGLPLALHQAGAYLGSSFAAETDFFSYGQAMATQFENLLGRGDDDRARVISTWELSLDALVIQGKTQARALLRMLSCFAPAVPMPPLLLSLPMLGHCLGGQAGVEEGLTGLLSVGLIEDRGPRSDGARPLVVVHPLVAETIRYRAGSALVTGYGTAVDVLRAAIGGLDTRDSGDRAGWLALLPHLQALLDRDIVATPRMLDDLSWSARNMSEALRWGGSYPASFDIADAALRRATSVLGPDNERVLALRHVRAFALNMLARWPEAEAEFRDVLNAQTQILDPDHPDTLSTRHMIADVLVYLGQPVPAAAEFQQVLTARRKVLGTNHPDTLNTWHNTAWVLAMQNRHPEAEAEFRQVLNVRPPEFYAHSVTCVICEV